MQWRKGSAISAPKTTVLFSLHRRRSCLWCSGNAVTVFHSSPDEADLDTIVLPLTCWWLATAGTSPTQENSLKQDLFDSGPFLYALSGHMWELPSLLSVADSISWTGQSGSLQICSAYPTCGSLTCLWNHTLTKDILLRKCMLKIPHL